MAEGMKASGVRLADAPIHLRVHLIKVCRLCHGVPVWHGKIGSRDMSRACMQTAAFSSSRAGFASSGPAAKVVKERALQDAERDALEHSVSSTCIYHDSAVLAEWTANQGLPVPF